MLSFLDLPDLARMARVSRHWRTLISDDFFWEQKYSRSSFACAPPTAITPSDGSLPEGVLSYRAAFRRRAMWWSLPGLCIEVLDTYNIWSVARVLLVLDENHVLIWFEGWGDEWLMWIDRRFDLARVRPCGSEVAGLGKGGPIHQGALIAKQAQAIEMIRELCPPKCLPSRRWYSLTFLRLLLTTKSALAWQCTLLLSIRLSRTASSFRTQTCGNNRHALQAKACSLRAIAVAGWGIRACQKNSGLSQRSGGTWKTQGV